MHGLNPSATVWSWRCTSPHTDSLEEPLAEGVTSKAVVVDADGRFLHRTSAARALAQHQRHGARCDLLFSPAQILLRWNDLTAPARRIPVQPRRELIFARDNFECQYCGERLSYRECTVDHVVPASWFDHRGDAWTWDNLTTACGPCNFAKGDIDPKLHGLPRIMPVKPTSEQLADYFDRRSLINWDQEFEVQR